MFTCADGATDPSARRRRVLQLRIDHLSVCREDGISVFVEWAERALHSLRLAEEEANED